MSRSEQRAGCLVVAEEVVQQLQDAKKVLAALSRLPEESTPLEHGRAIAERLEVSAAVVRVANLRVFGDGEA